MYDLLNIPFHQLSSLEISHLQRVSQHVFAPLLRPFQSQNLQYKFNIHETLKSTFKYGDPLPQYKRVPIPTRTAKLAIAMSLSGRDRCSAVSLIPLLVELKKLYDFDIYIYTTDLIKAEIKHNTFFNQHLLDWNNVNSIKVFYELNNHISKLKGEPVELLIIDSYYQSDSKWFTSWNDDLQYESNKEYNAYVDEWASLNERLAGDLKGIEQVATGPEKRKLNNLINKNCIERFEKTPSMQQLLLEWLLNPNKSKRTSESYPYRFYYSNTTRQLLSQIKNKVNNIHWMAPYCSDLPTLNSFLNENQIDYLHTVNSVSGFANVLSNIIHKKCTNRLTRPSVLFTGFQAFTDDGCIINLNLPDDLEHVVEKTEQVEILQLVKGSKKRLPIPPFSVIPVTHIERQKQGRDHTISIVKEPFSRIDTSISDYAMEDDIYSALSPYFSEIPLKDLSNPNISFSSKENICREILNCIKHLSLDVYMGYSGQLSLRLKKLNTARETLPRSLLSDYLSKYSIGDTPIILKSTLNHIQDCTELLSNSYLPFIEQIPLYQIAWQSRGDYSYKHSAITFSPESDTRHTIFHEIGHYLDHICPHVACTSYNFLLQRTYESSKITEIYKGEWGYKSDKKPFIHPYAGKVYSPVKQALPILTEITSMYLEHFSSTRHLAHLVSKDLSGFYYIVFVLLGGPILLVNKNVLLKEARSLKTLQHSYSRSSGYYYRKVRSNKKSSSGFQLSR